MSHREKQQENSSDSIKQRCSYSCLQTSRQLATDRNARASPEARWGRDHRGGRKPGSGCERRNHRQGRANREGTVDGAHSDKFAKGRIALQHGKGVTDESGVVKFRKVEIKPLQYGYPRPTIRPTSASAS